MIALKPPLLKHKISMIFSFTIRVISVHIMRCDIFPVMQLAGARGRNPDIIPQVLWLCFILSGHSLRDPLRGLALFHPLQNFLRAGAASWVMFTENL